MARQAWAGMFHLIFDASVDFLVAEKMQEMPKSHVDYSFSFLSYILQLYSLQDISLCSV